MAAKSDGEKTEAPTAKKKKDSRKEGQIAKTTEAGAWLQILVATFIVQLAAERAMRGMSEIGSDLERIAADPDPVQAVAVLGRGLMVAMLAVLPVGLLLMVVGVIAIVSQVGFVLATKAAKPKWSKVNPLTGLKNKFKIQGLWQGVKALIKLFVLTLFSWKPVLGITQDLLASGSLGLTTTAGMVAGRAMSLCRTVAVVGLALALADYGVQRWQIGKQLKMSKKEIKDEYKSQEGDAQVKGHIRRRQQDMSRNRMLASVADASAVIVNPTHIAVAISYKAGTGAPTVVAKGRGEVADRIREEAVRNFVPIVRDIALARTLEKACKIDQTIPADLYEAVARLLAFVMQLGRKASLMGGVMENPAATRLPIPEPVGAGR